MSELQLANACGSVFLSAKNFAFHTNFSKLCESQKRSKIERQKPNIKNPSLVESQAHHQVHDHVGEWPGPDHHQTDVKVYAQYTQVTASHHNHVAQLEEALIR